MSEQKQIYIIDGNSLLFRAYYATAYGENPSIMRTKDGIPTNAIFAFCNMLSKILQGFDGNESIFVGFDTDKETFRKQEFADYKANRKPCPPELVKQFPISRELLKALSIMYFEEHGLEGDDICGTVAKLASAAGYDVTVYTSDKDYLQLIDPNIKISLLKTGLSNMEVMDEKTMPAKFGFSPKQIIDFKGLRGDSSDNLPGIPGVGDVTAVKLIQQYGSFDAIVEAAKTMTSKVGENIRNNVEMGRECYKLATIKTDVVLPFKLEDLVYQGYDYASVNDFAQKYELKQFLARLPISLKKGGEGQKAVAVQTISSIQGLQLGDKIGLALDVDEQDYHDAPIEGIAISTATATYYEAVTDLQKDQALIALLGNPKIQKNVYDGKLLEVGLNRLGIAFNGVHFDILLAAYLLDSSLSNSSTLVYSSFGVDIEGGKEEEEVSLFASGHPTRLGKMAFYALTLEEKALISLKSVDAYKLYNDIEAPLSLVLAKMEIEGFPLNLDTLNAIGKGYREKLATLEKEIDDLAGGPFNISSPKQVGDLLFNKLHLAESKSMSTSVDVLTSLVDKHPIVQKILDYRKYSKLVGTYIDGLAPHVKKDGKIHTCFNQAQTTTGRLSSSNPNLQNISARDEEGKLIRKAFFYPEPGYEILSLDYGQIELRILAALSNCKAYIDVFNTDRDVHSETAKKIFKTEEVTPLMRRKAKAVNFAIIYGTTVWGLADQIGDTPKEAEEIIRNFYLSYPEVGAYLQSIIADVEHNGYVTTMFGRRRYLRDITDTNYAKREAAKRAALNAPVQGTAADVIKLAMLKIDDYLKSHPELQTKMVLQIHDELLFKVPEAEKAIVLPVFSDLMIHAVSLPVKLTVEGGFGKTWWDAK
jgi:DNA polymerase-1